MFHFPARLHANQIQLNRNFLQHVIIVISIREDREYESGSLLLIQFIISCELNYELFAKVVGGCRNRKFDNCSKNREILVALGPLDIHDYSLKWDQSYNTYNTFDFHGHELCYKPIEFRSKFIFIYFRLNTKNYSCCVQSAAKTECKSIPQSV